MKVEIIGKAPDAQVELVAGGVYRGTDVDPDFAELEADAPERFRVLVRHGDAGDEYAWMDPNCGEAAWAGWQRRAEIENELLRGEWEYVPNARLVIDLTK